MTESSKQNKLRLAKELSYDIRRTITDFLSENIKEEGISKADWLLISNLGLIITSDYVNKPFAKSSQLNETEKYMSFLSDEKEEKNSVLREDLKMKEKELEALKQPPLGSKREPKIN
ncbi:MAG: hypothetical protein VXW15_07650 [Bdellovibrionota bacterium]|nr:hypothetical protein [Bdellovibrionota bacterium]